jgi:hypothetical protein
MITIRRLLALTLCGIAGGAANADPLTPLVEVSKPARIDLHSPQSCLLNGKACESLSKTPWRPCLVDTKPCPQNGELIAVSPPPPHK